MSKHDEDDFQFTEPMSLSSAKSGRGSETKKQRCYSEDTAGNYSPLPEIRVEGHKTAKPKRASSFRDVSDGCVSSKMGVPRSRSYDSVLFEFREVAAEDFANQLTLLDLKLFKAITVEELIDGDWEGKEKLRKAPNVVAFSRRFNNVTFWTQRELLGTESIKIRAAVLRHFIKIAKKLYDLNNLHSMMAVVLALQSAPIHRLIQTWRHLPNKDRRTLQKLERLVSVADNRQALRDHLEKTSLPCIPYLGLYLQDLLYIKAMSKRNPRCNSVKRDNLLRTINYFQSSEYRHIEPLHHIQKYLLSVEYMEEMQKFVDDNHFKLSLELEPGESKAAVLSASDKLPRRKISPNGHHCSDVEKKSSTLPSIGSATAGTSLLPDGFVSPHTKTRRMFGLKARNSPAVETESLLMGEAAAKPKPFMRKHKKHHSLGRILDIEISLDQPRYSCLEVLETRDGLHTPLASAEELSSSDSEENEDSPNHSSLSTIMSSGDRVDSSDDASFLSLDQSQREEALYEGYLKRKTVRKRSKRVYRPRWTRCWGIIESGFFLLFDPNGTSNKPERSAFKSKPRMCLVLDGCTVAGSTAKLKPIFTLTDDNGTVRKFYTSSMEEMEKWVNAISQAIQMHKKEDEPLITL